VCNLSFSNWQTAGKHCRQATQRRLTSRKGASGEAKSLVCVRSKDKPCSDALTLNWDYPPKGNLPLTTQVLFQKYFVSGEIPDGIRLLFQVV